MKRICAILAPFVLLWASSAIAEEVPTEGIPPDFDLRQMSSTEMPYEVLSDDGRDEHLDELQERRHNRSQTRRIIFHVLNAADFAVTAYCFESVEGCRETNPIYDQHIERVLVGKLAVSALFELVHDENRPGQTEFEWIVIAMLGVAVGNNLVVVF